MWHSRLFWKLFLVAAGVNLALALAFSTTLSAWQEDTLRQQIDDQLHGIATMLQGETERMLHSDVKEELQQLVQERAEKIGVRMTIIQTDGLVLADSKKDPLQMENHSDRVEMQHALSDGIGRSTRISPTLKIPMRYLALPIEHDNKTIAIARVALKMDLIENQVRGQKRIIWSLAAIGAVIAILLCYTVVGRIIRPLAQLTRAAEKVALGQDVDPVHVESPDEIGSLANAFNRMQDELSLRVEQLGENSNRLATILESMTEGVIAVDSDETVLLANSASGQLLGFSAIESVGRSLQEVVRCHPLHEIVLRVLKEREPYPAEFELSGETRRMLSVWAGPLPGESSLGVLVVLHDVTELRRLETIRRDFVANVSHELKTPLSAIKAYAETLRLGALNDPDNNLQFVKRIEEQSERLHILILDLLVLARVESGSQAPQPSTLSIMNLVESRFQQYEVVAREKELQLNVVPDQEEMIIFADEESLTTILDNLMNNAINYNRTGGRVDISWWQENEVFALSVEDSGVGIAPQDQERVFERFYRVDKARSRTLGSTGLGLAIVKHLVQSLDGSVELTSRLGEGTRIVVRIPMVEAS